MVCRGTSPLHLPVRNILVPYLTNKTISTPLCLSDFIKVTIIAIVYLAPVIDCQTSPTLDAGRNAGRHPGETLRLRFSVKQEKIHPIHRTALSYRRPSHTDLHSWLQPSSCVSTKPSIHLTTTPFVAPLLSRNSQRLLRKEPKIPFPHLRQFETMFCHCFRCHTCSLCYISQSGTRTLIQKQGVKLKLHKLHAQFRKSDADYSKKISTFIQ